VEAGYSISWVSQNDADDLANQYLYSQGFGQSWANENFGCIPDCSRNVGTAVSLYTQIGEDYVTLENACQLAGYAYDFCPGDCAGTVGYNDNGTVYNSSDTSDCTKVSDGVYILATVTYDPYTITYTAVTITDGVITVIDC
jgi:hypothetical protein